MLLRENLVGLKGASHGPGPGPASADVESGPRLPSEKSAAAAKASAAAMLAAERTLLVV